MTEKYDKTRLKGLLRNYRDSIIQNGIIEEENHQGRFLTGKEKVQVINNIDLSIAIIKAGLINRGRLKRLM